MLDSDPSGRLELVAAKSGGMQPRLVSRVALLPEAEGVRRLQITLARSLDGAPSGVRVLALRAERLRRDGALQSLWALLEREVSTARVSTDPVACRLAECCLAYLERDRFAERRCEGAPFDRRVSRALTLIHADLARRWTLASLARAAGTSRPVLSRRFLEATGESPLRYLARCRLEYAAELLIRSDGSLAEIAEAVGYATEFAFSRAFTRHHGVRPGRYRHASTPVLALAA